MVKSKVLIAFWFGVSLILVSVYVVFFAEFDEPDCLIDRLPLGGENPHETANLPFELYDRCHLNSPKLFIGKKCTKFPVLDQLEFDNLFWQKAKTADDVELYLFGAYYDNRSSGAAVLKIVAASEGAFVSNAVCQIWFKNHGTVVESRLVSASADGGFRSSLIGCDVPEIFDDTTPRAVSVASYECSKSTNVLRIETSGNRTTRTKLGVCAVNLFSDVTPRDLVEWIEFTKSLGTSKIYLYHLLDVPDRPTRKILRHYRRQGSLETIPFTLPGNLPNILALQEEIFRNSTGIKDLFFIPLHDCFYSHLQKHRYISTFKVDRVSFPSEITDWRSWQYEKTQRLSIRPHGTREKRISAYDTLRVTSMCNNKCLDGLACRKEDVSVEFFRLDREELPDVLSRVENVLNYLKLNGK